ncbi:reverse transcriptase domain-containing protein [Tanacetum coccineum]
MGIATVIARTEPVYECRWSKKKSTDQEEGGKLEPGVAGEERVLVNPAYLEQMVTIRTMFSFNKREQLIRLLKDNLDVFACTKMRARGKFLGYMVTSKGIRANPKKTKAIADMQSPKTLKEMQSLSGKLAALNRFLSKSAKKSSPVLQNPKKHHERKQGGVPVVRRSGTGDYGSAHRADLNKPEASRKLAKYAVELGAYNIVYLPRNAIKGQVLAYFINEIPVGTKLLEVCSLTKEEESEIWTLYTDGASSMKGVGAKLVLIDPSGIEYTYDISLTFSRINNKAKYEALLMNGEFMASSEGMARYLANAKEYAALFKKFSIKNIPRNQNQKADVLSKLASVVFNHLTKEILVEVLNAESVDVCEVNTVVEEEEDNWMTPIIKCLEKGIWPADENEARTLRMKISQYVIEEGVMFKKSYLAPMLRCVGPLQANYITREVHEGACGMHAGARSVVAEIIRQGYFWPSMHRDTREVVDKCGSCQIHAPVMRLSKMRLNSIMAPWPFHQWGLDILGPLLDKLKYIVVAIDYFTKWIEAKPLAKITVKDQANEHGRSTPLSQRIGRTSKQIPDARVENKARSGKSRMSGRIAEHLVAHRTMLKTSNVETPFSLTYGSEAVISAEIGMPTYRIIQFNEAHNDQERRLNLDLIQERRETAAIREAKYNKKVEQYYNKRVRPVSFKVGDFVYRRNEGSKVKNQGKLGPNLEGPYRVIEAYNNGSYKLAIMNDREVPRTWHAINLRNCFM